MQEAVRYQVKLLGDDWKEGEVVVSNHPAAGGSHLPDITVITPVRVSLNHARAHAFRALTCLCVA
jgi:N-methylhydantoinase B/oxoprolinase/acetone carboxylase alpha subunit